MKNLIMDFIRGFKAGFNSTRGHIVGYIEYNGNNLPIIHSPDHVAINNSIFANCSVSNDEYRIVVDDLYIQAPQYVKDFVNQHELGHLYWLDNGHENKHTLNDEFMADAYSAQKVGNINAINSLNYIWTMGANTGKINHCLTFPSRLKELGADVSSMYIIGLNGKIFYEEDLRRIITMTEEV